MRNPDTYDQVREKYEKASIKKKELLQLRDSSTDEKDRLKYDRLAKTQSVKISYYRRHYPSITRTKEEIKAVAIPPIRPTTKAHYNELLTNYQQQIDEQLKIGNTREANLMKEALESIRLRYKYSY